LHESRSIAQVNEDEATKVASAVHPAAEPDVLADVSDAKCAAE